MFTSLSDPNPLGRRLREVRQRNRRRRTIRRAIATVFVGILFVAGSGMAWMWWLGPPPLPALPSAPGPPPDAHQSPVEPSGDSGSRDLASLHAALHEWIEATRTGDIGTQMRFYPERVPVYYRKRDVPRKAVRDEKVRVFGRATRLSITTGAPTVEVSEDGATARTLFEKRYIIEGPTIRRRGVVLQELRWTRAPDGWLIVGERDARVLRTD